MLPSTFVIRTRLYIFTPTQFIIIIFLISENLQSVFHKTTSKNDE